MRHGSPHWTPVSATRWVIRVAGVLPDILIPLSFISAIRDRTRGGRITDRPDRQPLCVIRVPWGLKLIRGSCHGIRRRGFRSLSRRHAATTRSSFANVPARWEQWQARRAVPLNP